MVGFAAKIDAESNDPVNTPAAVTAAGISVQVAPDPFNRHCTAPVTAGPLPCGAPTAVTFTDPCVVDTPAGAVNDGAPYPKVYLAIGDCRPPIDVTYASRLCPPVVPPTEAEATTRDAVNGVNDSVRQAPPSTRYVTDVGAEYDAVAEYNPVMVQVSAALTNSSQEPLPDGHDIGGAVGTTYPVLTSKAGPHPDHV